MKKNKKCCISKIRMSDFQLYTQALEVYEQECANKDANKDATKDATKDSVKNYVKKGVKKSVEKGVKKDIKKNMKKPETDSEEESEGESEGESEEEGEPTIQTGINPEINPSPEPEINTDCVHDNVVNERGLMVCVDCGEEVVDRVEEKEWRWSDNKHVSDPNRVQMRKLEERSIYRDVEGLGFSESIVSKANKIYAQVTQGKIFRGNSRRAIVFASIFHSYKGTKRPLSHDKLIKIFGLTRKTGLKGLKYVNLYAPKDSKIRTTYITPVNLIEEIMELFSATKEQIEEVIGLYEKIRNKSSRLNRSRPASLGSGIVFYWIGMKNKDISLKDFAKRVGLSELTINKIAKEVAEVVRIHNIL